MNFLSNKKFLISIIVVMFFVLIVSGSLAFFSDEEVEVNKLKIGDIKTSILEDFKNTDIKEPQTVEKKISINNPSNTESLVRISISKRWVNPNNYEEVIPYNDDLVTLNFAENFDEFGYGNNWYKSNDGYYYYKDILNGKAETLPLLSSVTFNNIEDDSLYKNKEFKVDIKVEAVQPTKYEGEENTIYIYNEMWRNIEDNNVVELLNKIVDKRYE